MIIVVNNIPYLADALRAHHEVMSVPYTLIDNALLQHTNCEALFIRTTTKITASLLENTKIRFIGTATSGVDHVDVHAVEQRSITLANAAGSNANAVAEWVLYAMLKRAAEHNQDVRDLVLGVVGFGNIGKLVTAYAQHLGMKVLVYDAPLQHSGYVFPSSLATYSNIEELMQHVDVVTNHIPLTTEGLHPTAGMFSAELLELTKDDVHFIHTSRGGIVDEDALLRLVGARRDFSIDVWNGEPEYSVQLARSVRLATPHISGHSEDGIIEAAESLLEAYSKFGTMDYDASIITRHRNKDMQRIEEVRDLPSTTAQLAERLKLEVMHEALKHPLSESPAGRRAFFLERRFSYHGRRELFQRPTLL